MGVLVSVFAATAFAADCKVNDSDLSGEYVGGCVNGLAQGRGKAKGRDTYEGEFKQGNKHGKGIYTWANGDKYDGDYLDDRRNGKGTETYQNEGKYVGDWVKSKKTGKATWFYPNGSKYEGEFVNGSFNGFGKLSLVKGDSAIDTNGPTGKLVGSIHVKEGKFNNGKFISACSNPQSCEAQERREAAERVANACNAYYQGKSIGFKPAGLAYWGSVLDAVVLGKGNGNVSIKIVDRHFSDDYGKTLEMSCTSDQLQ